MKTFGQTIKKLRIDHDMTLRQAAASVGVSVSHLGRVETRMKPPSSALIDSLARLYSEDPNKLFVLHLADRILISLKGDYDFAVEALALTEQNIREWKGEEEK